MEKNTRQNLMSYGIRTRIIQLGVIQWHANSRDFNLQEIASYHSSICHSASDVQKWSVGFESSRQQIFLLQFLLDYYPCQNQDEFVGQWPFGFILNFKFYWYVSTQFPRDILQLLAVRMQTPLEKIILLQENDFAYGWEYLWNENKL